MLQKSGQKIKVSWGEMYTKNYLDTSESDSDDDENMNEKFSKAIQPKLGSTLSVIQKTHEADLRSGSALDTPGEPPGEGLLASQPGNTYGESKADPAGQPRTTHNKLRIDPIPTGSVQDDPDPDLISFPTGSVQDDPDLVSFQDQLDLGFLPDEAT